MIKIEKQKKSFFYLSDECKNCTSIMGKSLTKIKNRGCCFYFPKFELYDIQKMVKSKEGVEVLKKILSKENTKIYHFYIWAKGDFDREGYRKYIQNEKEGIKNKYMPRDRSIFFKTCPFTVEGKGCSIPNEFRSCICNFFICKEIREKHSTEYIQKLRNEALNYYKFCERENISLENLLEEKNLTLEHNLNEVIELLKNERLNVYECNL